MICLHENKEFSERVIRVNIPDECLAIRFVNKAFKEVLTGPEALYWNVFEDVEIRLYKAIDKQKEFTGTLTSYDADSVTLTMEDGSERTFEKSEIALIRLAFDF